MTPLAIFPPLALKSLLRLTVPKITTITQNTIPLWETKCGGSCFLNAVNALQI